MSGGPSRRQRVRADRRDLPRLLIQDLVNFAAGVPVDGLSPMVVEPTQRFRISNGATVHLSVDRLTQTALQLALVSRAFALALPDAERERIADALVQAYVDVIADAMDPDRSTP